MKIGRNDACPCGSGKKYKRCCIDNVSKQHAQVFDDVESMLAMNPHLTLDEINAALQYKFQDRNNQANADFCGMSPAQMSNWLYASFDELQWVNISTPSDLSASPVMRYLALIIDEAMQNGGAFNATKKGNLPTKIVKQASDLLPEFALSQYSCNISISEFAGSNEDKFNALHYARVLAELAGIIYRRAGKYHVKKSAQKQYKEQGITAFFLPMLETSVKKLSWAYFDSYAEATDLQTFWLFMLWRIQQHKSVDLLVEEVMTAFPDLMRGFMVDDYAPPKEKLGFIIESRFIERFLQFWGFITYDPRRFINNQPIDRVVNVQALLKQTFQFTLD